MERIIRYVIPARVHSLTRCRTLFTAVVNEVDIMSGHFIDCGRATRYATITFYVIGMLLTIGSPSAARDQQTAASRSTKAYPDDNGGITLPTGFCATVFADNIGHARHLVVAPNGVVYVNT